MRRQNLHTTREIGRETYRLATFVLERVLRALEELVRGPVPIPSQGRAPADNFQPSINVCEYRYLPWLTGLLLLRLLDFTEDVQPEVANFGRQPVQDFLAARRYEACDTHRGEFAVPWFRHVVKLRNISVSAAREEEIGSVVTYPRPPLIQDAFPDLRLRNAMRLGGRLHEREEQLLVRDSHPREDVDVLRQDRRSRLYHTHESRQNMRRRLRTLSSMSVFTMSAKRPERWKGSPQSCGGPIWKSVVRIRARSATFVSTACDIAFANAWNNSTEYSCGET